MGERSREVALATGVTLPTVVAGDEDGVPVVLLHGLMDSWRSYELILPHLPSDIRTVVPSQRGHGDATKLEAGYRPQDFAADAIALLDALGIDAAVFAGHSSHSFPIQHLAIEHPARVRGLVLIGAPFSFADKQGLRDLVTGPIASLTDPVDPTFVRDMQDGTFGPTVSVDFVETMIGETMKLPARVWREAFGALLDADRHLDRARVEAPVLLIWGDADDIVSRDDQDALIEALPRARLLVYEGIGHAPHWEAPERFAADLAAFARESA